MGSKTGIQWTDATWNPVTGCTKVSPGCAHCYAETVADRFWATQYPQVVVDEERGINFPVDHQFKMRPRRFSDVMGHADRLDAPLRWQKPRMVFVNSMSDLFHEAVPDEFILRVFNVMRQCEARNIGHTFQILTKRAERMRSICSRLQFDNQGDGRMFLEDRGLTRQGQAVSFMPILKRVWLGVSVENNAMRWRIDELLQTDAAVRFLSLEPLLEWVDLKLFRPFIAHLGAVGIECEHGYDACPTCDRGIDWVIVGGESGPKARPCDLAWVRSIRDQCRSASVPCFVKQVGSNSSLICHHHKGGNPAEWPEDLRVQEFPLR